MYNQDLFQSSSKGIILYGMIQSTCTQRVLTTLIEKDLQYEIKSIDLMNGENKVYMKNSLIKQNDFYHL